MTVTIGVLTLDNLRVVAQIHRAAFPDSALTYLGEEAVRRYYAWLMTGPHDAVALGGFNGSNLVGFCFGGVYRGALSGFLTTNRTFLIRTVLLRPWLVTNPLFRDRLAAALRIFRRSKRKPNVASVPSQVQPPVESFGILSVAVDPARQKTGTGRALMAEAEQIALARGFKAMDLTVHPENTGAVSFYECLGWYKVPSEGTWKGGMCKRLV